MNLNVLQVMDLFATVLVHRILVWFDGGAS